MYARLLLFYRIIEYLNVSLLEDSINVYNVNEYTKIYACMCTCLYLMYDT